jgi:hypothetical protein
LRKASSSASAGSAEVEVRQRIAQRLRQHHLGVVVALAGRDLRAVLDRPADAFQPGKGTLLDDGSVKELSIALRGPTPDLFVLNPVTHGDVVRREQPLPEVEVRAPVRQSFERGLACSAMNPSIADRICSGMPVFHACRSDARVVPANMPRRLKEASEDRRRASRPGPAARAMSR